MVNETNGYEGQLPAVQSPAPNNSSVGLGAAQGQTTGGAAADPVQMARSILMNNATSPRAMCEQFWQFKKQYLKQMHGIDID